ncbi:MAG: Ig-like domain-containing protein [Gemmatimonadota bacterium]|uniref:PKD domain-containing protein n=1 Tax=Candidatus Palauibacter scopulicola TaxID=3056741 RepID=UPI00238BDBD6|nr:Ig-like domain-containing protein [Candidatus Palauibacter scopulicola]MDE2663884.1 Ig-like domain-containing protein [Candidatus Palauibacter scopulicola]
MTLTGPAGGTVKEGETAYFEVRVAGNSGSDTVTVTYTVSGTATPGDDYTALPGEVTLRGGEANALIALVAVEDSTSDNGETVTLTLSGATGTAPAVVDTTSATVTIRDARSSQGENRPPRADAGSNQTVDERTLVNLDGSGSEDPDDDFLNYLWTKTSGPDVTIVGANTAFASFTAPEVTSTTTVRFRLRVGDGRTYSYATTSVTVNHVNRAPETKGSVSNAVTNRDSTGTVDMSSYFTELDNDDLTYTAESDDEDVVEVRVSGSEVTYEGVALGSATVTVTAADPEDAEAEQSFKVTVENIPPEAVGSISNTSVYVKANGTVDVSSYFRDLDGDALMYTVASSDSSAVTVSVNGSTVTYTGEVQGTATVTVTARDPSGASAKQQFAVEVPNRDPVKVGSISDQSVHVKATGTVTVSSRFTDPDMDALSYEAESDDVGVVTVSVDESTVTFKGVSQGTATVTVTASDPHGGEAEQEFDVTVPNRDPTTVGTISDRSVYVGASGNVDVASNFSDPDMDPLSFEAESDDEDVVTVRVSGSQVTFTGEGQGDATVTVTASDPHGGEVEQEFDVTVPNRAPTAVGNIASQSVYVGASDDVDVSSKFTDPDGDRLRYSASSSNTSVVTVSVSGSTVTFTGQDQGRATVTVTARDPDRATATQSFTVTVPNRAPTADAGNNRTVNERTTVTLSGSGTDPDGDPLTYRWTQRSGTSVTLSSSTVASPTFTAPEVTGNTALTFRLTVSDGSASDTDDVTITVRQVNRAPTAAAGANQTVDEGATVTLSGSGSDPDNDRLSYSWEQTAGPAATLSSTTAASSTFTAPEVTVNTVLTFRLTVSDGSLSDTDDVTVTVRHVNRKPTAAAGADQTVDEGATVTLNGSGSSDPDGDGVTYSWEQTAGTTVTLSSTTAASPTFTAPDVKANTTLTFRLTVSDGSLSDTDDVTVTVRQVNSAPTADAGSEQTVDERTTVTLNGSGSDPDGDSVTYAWKQLKGATATLSSTTVASPTFTAPEVTVDTDLDFELTVSDGSLSGADTVTVTVRHVNRAPTADAGSDQTVDERTTVTLDGSGSDPDGDSVSYAWKQLTGTTATLTSMTVASPTFPAPEVTADTDLTFELTVSDGSLSDMDTVTVTVRHVNRAPTADAGANQAVDEGATVTLSGSGSDPDDDTVSYAWTQTAGPTVTLSDTSAASPTFTAPEVTASTDLKFRLTVSDGTLSTTDDVTVTVRQVDGAPTANAGSDQTVDERTTVTLSGSGSDPDGDSVTYAWKQLTGTTATLSSATVASPTFPAPEVTADTDLTFELTVSDGTLSGVDTVTVTVRHVNRAPTATGTIAAQTVAADGSGSVDVSSNFTDADGDALSYTVEWTDSTAVTVSVTGSTVAFTGKAQGSATVTVTAADGDGAEAEQSFTVTVTASAANRAPLFDPAAVTRTVAENSAAGTAVGAPVTATDPDNNALTYSLAAGGDSASFAIGASTGQLAVGSGAELDYESGNTELTVSVVASDGTLADTATVTVTVTDADDPGVVRLDATVARVGMPVTATLTDQDGSRNAGKRRRWQRSAGEGSTWTNIARATSRIYTPVAADEGMYIRAVFTYTDGHGPNKRAESAALRVTGPNVAPVFSPDTVALTVAENSAAGAEVGTVTATDANGDTLAYSLLAGGDASSFAIGETTGTITVGTGATLDYEGGDTELSVSVLGTDGMLADTAAVTITITNADDPGAATLDAAQAEVGEALTATLTDEDEPEADATTVVWQRSADQGMTWTDIAGATATSYTPVVGDVGNLLRAVFTYTDGHGAGKRAESASVTVTVANRSPLFSPAAVTRTVAENSAAGTAVGEPVTATDPDNDALTYSLAGDDASSFTVGASTGQLAVGSGVELDYEGGDTELTVSVVASDGTLADTATVTVSVTDADDPGVVTLDAAVARVDVRITATLRDQDGSLEAGKRRQWQRSADGGTTWSDIAGATRRFYTPVAADEDMHLRAVFTYTDGHGPDKRAESAAVRVTGPNVAPVFSPATVTLTVAENSAAGTQVGTVTATDGNEDDLSYTFLSGGDASSFAIAAGTGAVTVGAAAVLDYESGDTELTFSVVASDGMLADTAAVTVTVTNADDPGAVTLDAAVARVGTAIVATLTDEDVADANATTVKWQSSSNDGTTWTDITGADTTSYTPVSGDAGNSLRAVFTYTDGHGPNKRAESAAVDVTDANLAPVFSPAAVERTVAENSPVGTAVGAPVTATDGNGDDLSYTFLSGGDASSFAINATTGQVTVGAEAALDYEGGDTELTVSVVASDGMAADTAAVTIRVTNVDDPGVVTLDAAVARVGTAIVATLTDQDVADANATTVKWQSSSDGGTRWSDINGATTTSYTPISADEGNSLRAVFAYTDGHGSGKSAESAVVRVTGPNVAPVFSPAAVERTVAENSAAGTAVGAAVTATDGNGDALAYSLASGGDASSFAIDETTGRIAVGTGAVLDYESGDTELSVSVVASDGMLADTAVVTITVTNADDPGVVALDANVARVGTRIAATLMDQDRSRNAGKRRRWQRSSNGGATWSNISGATTRFYTPRAADEGTLVRAVFTYTDGHGPNKRAESAAVSVVGAATPVVSFGATTYSVAPEGSVNVALSLSPAATATLAVGVTIGGSAPAATRTVTFGVGDTEQTLAVSAAGLSVGDTVLVAFGTLPSGTVAAAPTETRVIVRETGADIARDRKDERPVRLEAAFAEPAYTAVARDGGVDVAVRLSPPADREVIVPVTATGAASAGLDALGVPESVRFAPGDTIAAFTVDAPAGTPAAVLTLGFGELPERVSAGDVASSVIQVVDGGANAARYGESMELGLAVLGRSVAEGARQAVGGRIEAAMRGGSGGANASSGGGSVGDWAGRAVGTLASLAGSRPGRDATRETHRRPDGGEALERLLPQVSFSADIGGGQQASAPRFSVWGEGSAQGFRGEPGGIRYDGGMRALTVGADARLGTGAGVGLSVMRSGGEFDYASASLEGTLDHAMTTVHPYLFFQPARGLGLWAMAGYGTGQLETAGAASALDATLRMVSGGARLPLARRGAFGLSLASDVFGVRMSAGDEGAAGAATRGRALVEATWAANGLKLGAEAGGRYDGGDADTGAGAEAGASVAYAGSGLDLALNGRMAYGSGGHREWGVALRLAWDPGARNRGFRLVVSPGHGYDRSGVQRLLDDGPLGGGGAARPYASRVNAEAGYGIAAFGNGSLDTYGRFSAREGARAWTLGAGYDLARSLKFSVEAVHARIGTAPVRQGLRAGLDVRF